MTLHQLVREVPTHALIGPLIGFNKHRPRDTREHLSSIDELIPDLSELRCWDHTCHGLTTTRLNDLGEPPSCIDDPLQAPGAKSRPGFDVPGRPVYVLPAKHHRGDALLLFSTA